MKPRSVVVSGYATLDYVVHAEMPFKGEGTVTASIGVSGAWPRPGGAALYASRRIAAAGLLAHPITQIGDDDASGQY